MKATPKLQDTLEVFVELIEDLKVSIGESRVGALFLAKRIEELKTLKVEPDLRQLNEIKDKLISDFSNEMDQLERLLDGNYLKLEELQIKRKTYYLTYPLYLLIAFLISVAALYFAISTQHTKSKLQDDYTSLKSYNNSLELYIKESRLINDYHHWLEGKKSK